MPTAEVAVVRVFTDPSGSFGNPLGIVDGSLVPSPERLRLAASLGYSEVPAGTIRSRAFAPAMGLIEDEATGSAATQLTARLARDLHITQGQGSHLHTTFLDANWSTVGGRVHSEPARTISF